MQAVQARWAGPAVGGRRSPLPAAAATPAATTHPSAGTVRCSAAGGVQEAASTSTSGSSTPASWPSAEARRAGYGSSPREPALHVPAQVTGRLPAWLRGKYIRNGPGELSEMEVRTIVLG